MPSAPSTPSILQPTTVVAIFRWGTWVLVVGMLLSFPGVLYLAALHDMAKLNPGTVPTVLLVVGFCLMQQICSRYLSSVTSSPRSPLKRR
jgi:uncharacterized membrane protein YgdD (TMEM256/DUF423 family)